jgi:RNA polymerase sigma factor (sigma-70 family)
MSTTFKQAAQPIETGTPFFGNPNDLLPSSYTGVFKELGVCWGLQPPMQSEELLRAHMALIDTIIDRVCRRSRLTGADAEDFRSAVKLALIENDYALLHNAAQRSSLAAWLTVVIQRLAVDERMRAFGRWQTSAAARRLGEAGILAETLLLRDRRTIDEALPLVRALDPSVTRERLEEIASALPERTGRPRRVDLGADGVENLTTSESADARAMAGDVTRLADRASRAVRTALDGLPDEDRMLLRFRFGSSMSIADISRILRLPQRPLYRRIEALLATLRRVLGDAGVDAGAVSDLIGSPVAEMQFGLAEWKTGERQQSSMGEGH